MCTHIRRSLKGAAFRTPQIIPAPPSSSQAIRKASRGAPSRARQARGARAPAACMRIPAALGLGPLAMATRTTGMRTRKCASFLLVGPHVASPPVRRLE